MYATMPEGDAQKAARAAWRLGTPSTDGVNDSITELTALIDRVCAEARIWAPDVAAHTIRQSRGDAGAAAALVRVWAATLPHTPAITVGDDDIRTLRRLTSAFQDIPGGQWLGLAPEMASRLIEWPEDAADEPGTDEPTTVAAPEDHPAAPRRSGQSRVRDLFSHVPVASGDDDATSAPGLDPASAPIHPPHDRPTAVGLLAGSNGDVMSALAVAVMNTRREAILVELEAGDAEIRLAHPVSGEDVVVTRVPVVQAEVVLDSVVNGQPGLVRGWGITMGNQERRAISAALIDAAVNDSEGGTASLTLDMETILTLSSSSTNDGFVDHLKLPHYASFAAYLSRAEGDS